MPSILKRLSLENEALRRENAQLRALIEGLTNCTSGQRSASASRTASAQVDQTDQTRAGTG